jgi:hypothetical protein
MHPKGGAPGKEVSIKPQEERVVNPLGFWILADVRWHRLELAISFMGWRWLWGEYL